jgi:ATP-dependent 26S proteasome regulatory subunit
MHCLRDRYRVGRFLDGFDTDKGLIIMAATNRPGILDLALLRPGRFDRHIAPDRPDLRGREQLLKVHIKNIRLAPGMDVTELATRTPPPADGVGPRQWAIAQAARLPRLATGVALDQGVRCHFINTDQVRVQ